MVNRHAPSLLDLSDPERLALAIVLRTVVRAYDALFGFWLPYVMSMHQAPTDAGDWLDVSHVHVGAHPAAPHRGPAQVLPGSELGAGAYMNDTVPEQTAAALREAVARSVG